ncbi:MAG: histidine ammonia-lyase [Bacteroidota bacterium]
MPTSTYTIQSEPLALQQLARLLAENHQLQLSDDSRQKVQRCREFLENKLQASDALFYGINTGFGSLCNIAISDSQISSLQNNLVQSHACGMGDPIPPQLAKLILFLKIQGLSLGYSGVRPALIDKLLFLYNNNFIPVIYEMGSLGASGDLAPLAHLSLPLIGMGEIYQDGQIVPTAAISSLSRWKDDKLHSKEGLALLNGTQFSTAYACWCLIEAKRLLGLCQLTSALSIDAFDCRLSPFDDRIHHIRPHSGQRLTAATIRAWLAGSEIAAQKKQSVQDPYAFRCTPQVHGASWAAIQHAEEVVLTEINAVTDNPSIIPEEDAIISGGNFHAQPIALVLDYLAIALSELGSIAERRTYQLLTGQRGLPPFLIEDPGLHSGMMIAQYTAASMASQNKQWCTPASVDSIVSSNGQEDHVSMAANAGLKARKVVQNLERLIAIEFMTAAQALEHRRPLRSSPMIEEIHQRYRQVIPKLNHDRILSRDMNATISFLQTLDWQALLPEIS